jgi:hypothetical protein
MVVVNNELDGQVFAYLNVLPHNSMKELRYVKKILSQDMWSSDRVSNLRRPDDKAGGPSGQRLQKLA